MRKIEKSETTEPALTPVRAMLRECQERVAEIDLEIPRRRALIVEAHRVIEQAEAERAGAEKLGCEAKSARDSALIEGVSTKPHDDVIATAVAKITVADAAIADTKIIRDGNQSIIDGLRREREGVKKRIALLELLDRHVDDFNLHARAIFGALPEMVRLSNEASFNGFGVTAASLRSQLFVIDYDSEKLKKIEYKPVIIPLR
jgi:hypothetical protein